MMNFMIAGVGGQGTVLASKLVASTAMQCGHDVRTTETIGMAQRGGCVVSHVRIGENIASPLISLGSAQAILAFEPAEAVRVLPYLADDGLLITLNTAVKPVSSSLSGDNYKASEMLDHLKAEVKNLLIIDGEELLKRCGQTRTLNVALLGVAAEKGVFPFSAAELRAGIKALLPPRYLAANLASFQVGRDISHEL